MANSNPFYVYSGSYLNGFGYATIIVTAGIYERWFYGEYFAFLDSEEPMYDEDGIRCEPGMAPEEVIEIDTSMMGKETIFQAEMKLSRILRNNYKQKTREEYPFGRDVIRVSPGDESDIRRLIMRNKFSEKIRRVRDITKSDPLRMFLCKYENLPRLFAEPNHI